MLLFLASFLIFKLTTLSCSKTILTFFLFILTTSLLRAQDSSIDIGGADSAVHKKILIIPFEPELYMSDMDREIGKANQLNQSQIVEKFRINFDRVLENTVQLKNETQTLLHDESSIDENAIVDIYSSISFEFTPVKRTQTKKEKTISSVLLQKKTPQKEATIKNGQVFTVRDTLERYMKTIVTDSLLLQRLNEKTHAEIFLFVNQFELKDSFTDVIELQNDTYQRELRIHFSVLNKKGIELVGGIAKCRFANNIILCNEIVTTSFPCAAKQIADAISAYENSLVKPKK